MRRNKRPFLILKKIIGMTLLEVMLVLAIGASFLLFAVSQYHQFREQASFIDVKRNVDILFQALGRYYQTNCRSLSDSEVANAQNVDPTITQGTLAPGGTLNVDYTKSNVTYGIAIRSALRNQYLPRNWPTAVPDVDATTTYKVHGSVNSFKGYGTAFIFLLTTKNAYACWNFQTGTGVVCSASQPIQDNTVAFWLAQVSVKIANDPTGKKTLALLGPTGANCASSVPDSCDGSTTPHYLIWQRLPTKSGSQVGSDLWESQTQEVLFNQLYRHDIMYEMALPPGTLSGSSVDPYYLCGN
jgi:type II secretory pathway pseudopilin PulG